jgi:hypothetical protein
VFARSSKFSLFDPAKEMVSGVAPLAKMHAIPFLRPTALCSPTVQLSDAFAGGQCDVHAGKYMVYIWSPRPKQSDSRALSRHAVAAVRGQVYIEMTKEEKSKGKAAVDLVGSQIGKSGAAWLTQVRI